MGLFGFGKKSTIRCARCNNTVKQDDIRGHEGKVYCSFCYNRILEEKSFAGKKTERTAPRPPRTINVDTTYDYRQMPASLTSIKEAFDKTETKYRVNHFGDQWELVAGVNGKANIFEVKYICKDSDPRVIALRVFSLCHVENHQKAAVHKVLNTLNETYRYVRFTLDSDNDVKVEYDFPDATTNHGAVALELLLRTVSIIDDSYPKLMQTLWS